MNKQRWTTALVAKAHAWYMARPERTLRQVGERHGVSYERISQVFEKHGLYRKPVGGPKTVRPRSVIQQAARAMSWAEACRILEVSDVTARRIFAESDIERPVKVCDVTACYDGRLLRRVVLAYERGEGGLAGVARMLGFPEPCRRRATSARRVLVKLGVEIKPPKRTRNRSVGGA